MVLCRPNFRCEDEMVAAAPRFLDSKGVVRRGGCQSESLEVGVNDGWEWRGECEIETGEKRV